MEAFGSGLTSTQQLDGRVALVTGGARGIGRQIVERFLAEGASVIAIDVDEEVRRANEALPQHSDRLSSLVADVASRDEMHAAVQYAVDRYGALDIAVCNAGFSKNIAFLELTDDDWCAHLDVVLTGVFITAQEAARTMVGARRGSIIVITSINADRPAVGTAHYSAAKAGAFSLVETMALELGPLGIRVNAIAPGCVDTRMSADYLRDPDRRRRTERSIPLGRAAQPRDIAGVALFLASDESSYITGISVRVDGGLLIGWTL